MTSMLFRVFFRDESPGEGQDLAGLRTCIKNSPVSAYDSRFGPQKTDSEPLELLYAPINVPGSSFSTGWVVFDTGASVRWAGQPGPLPTLTKKLPLSAFSDYEVQPKQADQAGASWLIWLLPPRQAYTLRFSAQ